MPVDRLEITNVRNIAHAVLVPAPGINLIYGPNASGKTSVLEAIYLLGRGRSFRAKQTKEAVRHGESELQIVGRVAESTGEGVILGLSFKNGTTQLRARGKDLQRASEAAQLLPLLLFTPESHRILSLGGRQRRRFLDWGVFHVERSFIGIWSQYVRALRQRNAALRGRDRRELIVAWDNDLIKAGMALDKLRDEFVISVQPLFQRITEDLLAQSGWELNYARGWSGDLDFATALKSDLESDLRLGYTRRGAHRADLTVRRQGGSIGSQASGGQQKLLFCALGLAQIQLIKARTAQTCVVMIDDLPAELDPAHRDRLLSVVEQTGAQAFITGTERGSFRWPVEKVFHVEHGQVGEGLTQ